MEELFQAYWWLVFPVSGIVVGAFRSWLAYCRRRDALDVLRSYAAAGREPPAALMARLDVG